MKTTNTVKGILATAVLLLPFSAFALSVNANVDLGADVNSSTSSKTSGTSNVNATTNTGSNVKLEVNSAGIEVKNSTEVSSDSDLKVFSKNVAIENNNVSKVDTDSSNTVEVKYKHPGRFLGIFPVRVSSTTYVDASSKSDTKVWTKMPWWNIFVTGTHNISSNVDASLKDSVTVSAAAQANASATSRAEAVEAIISAHAQADVK